MPSLLHLDPELADTLSAEAAARAARAVTARVASVAAGSWAPPVREPEPAAIGLLVLDGFVTSTLEAAGRGSLEVLGPGDLLRPWVRGDAGSLVASEMGWCVHGAGLRVAVLDGDVARAIAPWPEIFSALLHRSTLRARRLALQGAINRHPTIAERMLLTMWSHADRWGRVTREGVVVPLRLRHHELAALVAAQRPSVSKALSRLRAQDLVATHPSGCLLLGDPPEDYMTLRERSLLSGEPIAAPA